MTKELKTKFSEEILQFFISIFILVEFICQNPSKKKRSHLTTCETSLNRLKVRIAYQSIFSLCDLLPI